MGAHATETEVLLDDGGDGGCCRCCFILLSVLLLGCMVILMVSSINDYNKWSFDNGKNPEYSVAVAGFSGLDDTGGATMTMDPTFDLTVRIKEPRRWSAAACVQRGTTAVVAYRGVRLASGPVPAFCSRNENTTEVGSVMAWGTAVPVPRFARDQLADELGRGEADVDVKLMAPIHCFSGCYQNVIECKARLGHGEASEPCSVTYDAPTWPDGLPSARQQARKQLRTPQ